MEDEGKALLKSLLVAIDEGNPSKISKLKYDNLFFGSNLLDVVANYIFLSHIGISFNFGCQIIKKGTKLYRIRQFDEKTDFSDSKEWSYPPLKPENRANKEGEAALYLGTTENVCLLETHIKHGQKYVLGEYVVLEDILLGGFLECEDNEKSFSNVAGTILNAFLIAPSRSDKNKELFDYLDAEYQHLELNDLKMSEAKKISLPLKFGVLNKRNEFYECTNQIAEIFKASHPDGISYSSCYIPLATIKIVCSDHNIVLFDSGMKKVKFCKSEIKTNKETFTDVKIVKILLNLENEKTD